MPIRILHVVEAIGIGGGVENGISNLIGRMNSSRFEHLLCGVFQLGSQTERYPLDRVSLHCLKQKRGRSRSQVAPLTRLFRELKPDVVHSRNWGAIEAVVAARWLGIPAIHSEHGVEADPSTEPRRRQWIRRALYGLARQVFAVSYELQESLVHRTGLASGKIGVIHNGVDTKRFCPSVEARMRFRAELGIADHEFIIGCVGRMNPIKDYPTLLRAADTLSGICPSLRILFVGEGPERTALEQLVARSTLGQRVRFLGVTPRVPEVLNALDVYVLPSITEGISNSLLEAMAAGVPVVATRTGGNPEVVLHGHSGLLFPIGGVSELADTLAALYGDPEQRQRLADGGRRRVLEEFSLESMIRHYEDMYLGIAPEKVAAATQTGAYPAGKLSI
jgi:sugar transferase (PEP-CTERM/EpsH1 system associated)